MIEVLVKPSLHRVFKLMVSLYILLLIPFIASFLSDEVNWSILDYLVAVSILSAFSISVELALRFSKSMFTKLTAILLFLFLFALIWVELAVGVFGGAFSGN